MDLPSKRGSRTSTGVTSFSPTLNFIASHGGAKGRIFFRSEEEANTYYSSSTLRTPSSDQTDRLHLPLRSPEQALDAHGGSCSHRHHTCTSTHVRWGSRPPKHEPPSLPSSH